MFSSLQGSGSDDHWAGGTCVVIGADGVKLLGALLGRETDGIFIDEDYRGTKHVPYSKELNSQWEGKRSVL